LNFRILLELGSDISGLFTGYQGSGIIKKIEYEFTFYNTYFSHWGTMKKARIDYELRRTKYVCGHRYFKRLNDRKRLLHSAKLSARYGMKM